MNQEKFANDFETVDDEEVIRQLNERLAEVQPKLEKILSKADDLEEDLKKQLDALATPGSATGYMVSLPVGILTFVGGGNPLGVIGGITAICLTSHAIRKYLAHRTEKQYDEVNEDILYDLEDIDQLTERLKKLQIKKLENEGATWESVVDANGLLSKGLILTAAQQEDIPDIFKNTPQSNDNIAQGTH